MPDSKDREAQAWSDVPRPTLRFDYATMGTDAYEEGLEMRAKVRALAKLREDEPDPVFVPKIRASALEW